MSKNKDSMTPERWSYVKGLNPPPGRLFFVSQQYVSEEVTNAKGTVVGIRWVPAFQFAGIPKGRSYINPVKLAKKLAEQEAKESSRE